MIGCVVVRGGIWTDETPETARGGWGWEVERHEAHRLVLEKPGKMAPAEYDRMVADLVNFLVYVGEQARETRETLGIYVLLFLGVVFVLAYALKKEFWKDIH